VNLALSISAQYFSKYFDLAQSEFPNMVIFSRWDGGYEPPVEYFFTFDCRKRLPRQAGMMVGRKKRSAASRFRHWWAVKEQAGARAGTTAEFKQCLK
jgi:hypothetical protein